MRMLTIGNRKEWERFEKRHGEFLERFPALERACNAAFSGARRVSLVDAVVFGLGRVCAEEFLEMLVLCGNGYGFAATRLKRSMYERAVTARYIHAHPDQAERFVRYSTVQKGKLARVWLEQFRAAMPPERVQQLEDAIVEARKVRDDYVITCDKCGHPRPSPGWGPDVVTMAREANFLFPLLGTCYYEALLHAHATVHSVESFIHKRDGHSGWTFDFEQPQHPDADHAVFHGHTILLDVLDLQQEHFKPEGLPEALDAAGEAYRAIWKVPDGTPPTSPPTTG